MDEDDAPAGDGQAGDPATEWISTGSLPSDEDIRSIVEAGYERFRHEDEGRVADYIPALAEASPDTFGVCVAGVHGRIFAIGDAEQEFTIQSISKLFVFALVCDVLGPNEARRKLGVNSTGLPFDSVMGVELNEDRTMNPMVNAGALATTSLVPGDTAEEKFEHIVAALSVFAGRQLQLDEAVYESEAASNDRNRGIAHLLNGYGRMYCDPDVVTDIYTRQCSLRVSARDLAVMGATLADGGVNRSPASAPWIRGPAGASCPFSPPPASTSARATGSTTSDCPGRAGSAGDWSPCLRARVASARTPRRSTRRATACGAGT